MDLLMNSSLGEGFKSKSQITRRVTEEWGIRNLYCIACESDALSATKNNTKAYDFVCEECESHYQLKASNKPPGFRITDAGYHAMIEAIRSAKVPNLVVMHYDLSWRVRNLLLVPSFFFNEAVIEKRKPLSPVARRAGWIGCNILLGEVAPEGKVKVVVDGTEQPKAKVRESFNRVKGLSDLQPSLRGWALDVLRMIHKIRQTEFDLLDVYNFEEELIHLHPDNRNVRPKIRQQLQVLRDMGILSFITRGKYRLRSSHQLIRIGEEK